MARDLFGDLTRHRRSVHIACRSAAIIMHPFAGQSRCRAGSTLGTVVVLNPVAVTMENIGA
jgi:hypothetical protein